MRLHNKRAMPIAVPLADRTSLHIGPFDTIPVTDSVAADPYVAARVKCGDLMLLDDIPEKRGRAVATKEVDG